MFPYFRVATLNLTLQKRRSLLLGIAVATVTFLLLLLLSFVGGVTKSLTEAALTISSGHVNVGGFFKVRTDRAQAVITGRDELVDLVRKNVEGLDHIVDRGRGWGRVISSSSSLNTSLVGIESSDMPRMTALHILGPEKPDFGLFDSGKGAILFRAQAERLGVKVGETVTFVTETTGSEAGTVDLTLVAIASDLGFLSNFSILVSKSAISNLYHYAPNTAGAVHIYLKNISRAGEVSEKLRTVLLGAGYKVMDHDPQPFFMKFRRVVSEDWKGQKLDLSVWEDEVSFLYWIITSLNGLSVFLTGVLGLIIAVGIANTTWMTVRERTKEMGTLRAIGMLKHQVLLLYLLESVILGFLSATFGAFLGSAAVFGLDAAAIPIGQGDLKAFLMSDTFRFVLSPGQLILSVMVISMLTGAAAAFPAWRASKLQPVVALGHAS